MVAIEIPQGSANKYEIDAESGQIILDRVQSMPVAYPGNYGSVPSTQGGDGDPLDGLVLSREPIAPGTQVKVRALGVLKMIDGGEQDDKLITVPVADVDPAFDIFKNVSDLPPIQQQQIEQFFAVYKNLPEGRKKVELSGYDQADRANELLRGSAQKYQESCR
ncbi:inorganic diphosphatase [Tsukamurella asaccharolytica]|uniref:Inorganic pyrophosphatase n=2 Tax=Tsukamurella asaccharolytica TaxID=2592067 RepID=A0A5C5R6B6_9ACTN|nr:inorganic diphosphatase [Tsukamurella asaccharolytica]